MNIKEEILLRTNKGLEIFCFYMPIDFVIKRNFRNPLYDDKRASCNIYLDRKSDCYRMKDFGNDAYSGDCFWFAATMIGLDVKKDFVKVLETIIRDLQLNIYIGKQERFEQRAMIMKPPKPTISQPADQPKLMEENFSFYMPIDFVPKRNFRNPLYEDKRASCNIYLDTKSQCYRMKDFGNEAYSGDCFWFAATMLGLDVRSNFRKVLLTIIQDLNLNITVDFKTDENRKTKSPKDVRLVSPTPTNAKERLSEKKKVFKLYEQPFNAEELSFWLRYGITDRILQRYHVKSLFRYETISNQGKPFSLTSTREEPMFCYMMGDFVKLYRPQSKLRFLYGGDKLKDYIFGFEQLPSKGDVLFITGGEKDVLSLSSHHFNAICFNSETASIPEPIIESLQLRFRHIVLLYDTDETGLREAERQAKLLEPYHVFYLRLSLQGTKAEKDISDFFALGKTEKDLTSLLTEKLSSIYTHTIMMLQSCEIDYDNPPDASKSVVAVNGVPLGTQDNLFCITGGEGTGKSNYVGAILAGALGEKRLPIEKTLGLEITANPKGLAVLHYDTEQSEAQLHKNLGKTLRRAT